MKETRDTEIPQFQSLEEERAYWEARGPLAPGHKGRVNRPKPGQKRSSFLAVRLTGEEITRLRDVAAKQGLGPSTFARLILTSFIGGEGQPSSRPATAGDLEAALERRLAEHVSTYHAGEPLWADSSRVKVQVKK